MRRDLRIPADALFAFPGLESHVLGVVGGSSINRFTDTYVKVLPLPLQRLFEAFGFDRLSTHHIAGGK